MNYTELIPQVAWRELVRAAILLFVGIPAVWFLASRLRIAVMRSHSRQAGMLAAKGLTYVGFALVVVGVLDQLGVGVGPLLGAAGIVGVAIGFASQTSVSNLISGLFLIGERAFAVGDVITVGDVTGEVLSIDLLSVKVRTPDNHFIRLPNEMMVRSNLTNTTRFPIRRLDLSLGVAYGSDLERVKATLDRVAASSPRVLVEPPPAFLVRGFAASSIDLIYGVWLASNENFEARTELLVAIHQAFAAEGIEIPYPVVTVRGIDASLERLGSRP